MRVNWKLLLSTIVFGLCIAPTIISYQPYSFRWDDSDYLLRSIAVSRAFWSGNRHGMRIVMVDIHPPVMTLLGLPWGPLTSWDAAGKCFITLTALLALFVACCLFLLLRIGLKPLYFVIASVCVFAALGPYPAGADAHFFATGLGSDCLFAWSAFAALLLIPYEATTHTSSTTGSLVRGVLWGLIFSVGAITKVSFLYFIVLIIPILFIVGMRQRGLRSVLLSSISLIVCSFPVTIYVLRYGLPAVMNGWAASFGHDAPFYSISLTQFVSDTVRQSPGILLSAMFVAAGMVYLVVKRRDVGWATNVLPLLIMVGYCAISLASSNREIRYLFPAIIALPFLVALLISRETYQFPRRSAAIAAIVAFCCLLAAGLPTLHRANRQSIARSEAVLAQAVASNAKRVLLATDSRTLNVDLMRLAAAVSPSLPQVESDTLAYHAFNGTRIEDDFRDIRESDLIVFQDQEALQPAFTNQRVAEYEQYTRQYGGEVPVKVAGDISIYRINQNSR